MPMDIKSLRLQIAAQVLRERVAIVEGEGAVARATADWNAAKGALQILAEVERQETIAAKERQAIDMKIGEKLKQLADRVAEYDAAMNEGDRPEPVVPEVQPPQGEELRW